MRHLFDEQLQQLNIEMIQMGALCEDAITYASDALLKNSDGYAQRAKRLEMEVDRKERAIEQLCMRMILTQQPVASDLRNISSAMKMISDLERIGDMAADIAELSKFIEKRDWESFVHIGDMSGLVSKMLSDSIDSFVKKDAALAQQVIDGDDAVDAKFLSVKEEICTLMVEDSQNGHLCLDLLMVAKYFERIGDHATNIAEWVIYAMTGEKK